MESNVDEQPFVIIDIGSLQIKVGFSGEDRPRMTIPNQVQSNEHEDKKYYQVGDEILDFQRLKGDENNKMPRSVKSISLEGKTEEDFNEVIELIKYLYANFLKGVDSAKQGLLLIDNFNIDMKTRGKITSRVMGDLRPKKFCMMKAPLLSLFATGRTTGLVVDCGDTITSVCAVYEGYTLPHAIEWQYQGGRDATDQFCESLKSQNLDIQKDDQAFIREMLKLKERACKVKQRSSDGSEDDPVINKKYKLPNGNLINLSTDMIQGPMEIIFQGGEKGDVKIKSLAKMINETLNKCDSDIIPTLRKNVVVGGGNSMPQGFKERLRMEVEGCLIDCEPYRNFNSWVGGSMLSSTSVFCERVCMSKDNDNNKDYTNKVKSIFFN